MADISYTRTTWADGSEGGTPIDAAKLNNIEQGIVDTVAAIGPNDTTEDGTLKAQIDSVRESVSFESTTTATDYLTPAQGMTVTGEFDRQGRFAYLNMTVTTTAAQSSRWQVATVKEGYRPTNEVYGIEWSTGSAFLLEPSGRLRAYFSTSSAGTFYTSFTYMLAQ